MECISIINQKGGVGKTTTTVNLGAGLAERGKRVLLIDLDPQGHLTTHLGIDANARGSGIYEVLTKGLPFDSAIHECSSRLSVIPAQIELAAAEVELATEVGREVILRDILATGPRPFDVIIIDCPPSLGVLTLNALSASTQVLIPIQPHFLSLQGVGKLFETVALVARRINPQLRVAGMVMCMFESGTRLSGEVAADVSSFLESSRNTPVPWCDAKLLETRVRRNVKLAECPSYGQSIFEYAPRSNGALDYVALADEVLNHVLRASDAAGPEQRIQDDETTATVTANTESTPIPKPVTYDAEVVNKETAGGDVAPVIEVSGQAEPVDSEACEPARKPLENNSEVPNVASATVAQTHVSTASETPGETPEEASGKSPPQSVIDCDHDVPTVAR